ncbi:choline dehydrogenase-like flavoprotein [Mycobacterium sp. JS623]|uniref:GMC family oxidoreductase n=1 Tax=Mycobacterium sp. JS623 TaxID=212767 RepID=UPI0002A5641B|nr:GMC oxidoreductase [Mycobacterium sp. JS623]AGB23019.1 choline dehydrogenase-like flavoprotein [Mycobacterium sp. JS623]
MTASGHHDSFDYIVVGSGAGGGPLAARLAEAGMRVLLLEAGAEGLADHDSDDYAVPAFHGRATEDPATSWQYFVRHYANRKQQERDSKFVAARDGVFYPRAAALGGCTAHNAMITIYPHAEDWNEIYELTGDESWRAENMRTYFERLEDCGYRWRPWRLPANRLLAALATHLPLLNHRFRNDARHGFGGWLHTALADPLMALEDKKICALLGDAAQANVAEFWQRRGDLFAGPRSWLDPNDWRLRDSPDGVWEIPMAVQRGRRNGSRERIRDVARRLPHRLVVRTGCLVTRVLLDEEPAATGVEYIHAPHAYWCDPCPARGPMPPVQTACATQEVILAAGAFNSPQLLKLSGIGAAAELGPLGIEPRVELPGVGRNLRDRYEVAVVSRMTRDFSLLSRRNRFRPPFPGERPDPAYRRWRWCGKGVYATNGTVVGVVRRSDYGRAAPDLFVFGLPARFEGYYPGYSCELEHHRDYFTWAILKAHTENRAGEVRLRSADPRDPPVIDFHYFEEGSDTKGEDLDAVVKGVRIARDIMSRAGTAVAEEVSPGPEVQTDDQLKEWIRDNAWGHHASCTCPIGKRADGAVTDGSFRVHGVGRLRVVDASVFPRIPGFFIVTSIYMLAEKASETILADAAKHLTGNPTRLIHARHCRPR